MLGLFSVQSKPQPMDWEKRTTRRCLSQTCFGRDDVKCSWENLTMDHYDFFSESNDNNYRVIGVHGNSMPVKEELFFCLWLVVCMPGPVHKPMGEHRVLNTIKTMVSLVLYSDFKSAHTTETFWCLAEWLHVCISGRAFTYAVTWSLNRWQYDAGFFFFILARLMYHKRLYSLTKSQKNMYLPVSSLSLTLSDTQIVHIIVKLTACVSHWMTQFYYNKNHEHLTLSLCVIRK